MTYGLIDWLIWSCLLIWLSFSAFQAAAIWRFANVSIIIRRNRSCSASDSTYSFTFLRSVVCLPVCLSHSCTLLKPFDRFRCHLAGTLVGSNDTLLDRGPWEIWGLNVQPEHAITSPMLPSDEYKRKAIPPFAKLLWCLLLSISQSINQNICIAP